MPWYEVGDPGALETVIDSIADGARSLSRQRTVDETLHTIARVALSCVPEFDQVGISTVDEDGQVVAMACIGDLVPRLEEIQQALGEGPLMDTFRGGEVVAAPSLQDQTQWPRYVRRAVGFGIRSQLAIRLHLGDGRTLGGMSLYSTSRDEISADAKGIATLVAAHSAVALGHVLERTQLSEALHSRTVIGQSVGILMERHSMSEDRAFAFLLRASSRGNIKLRAIAQRIVEEHGRD